MVTFLRRLTPLIAAALVAALMATAMPARPARADDATQRPEPGLMWNRTGLPAIFPLQVKTRAGRDYVLVLIDDRSGAESLAAYIEGGTFFRVLVPPGTFRLRFAFGTDWRGTDALFGAGPETGSFTLPQPLTFRTQGLNRKAGHLVDLRNAPFETERSAGIRALTICQRFKRDGPERLALPGDPSADPHACLTSVGARPEDGKACLADPYPGIRGVTQRYCF